MERLEQEDSFSRKNSKVGKKKGTNLVALAQRTEAIGRTAINHTPWRIS
jgi:hypothetical protein